MSYAPTPKPDATQYKAGGIEVNQSRQNPTWHSETNRSKRPISFVGVCRYDKEEYRKHCRLIKIPLLRPEWRLGCAYR